MAQTEQIQKERSLGELFSELSQETSTLVRQEVALAQVELTQKATRIGTQVGYLVVGGAVAYAAMLVIVAALVVALAQLITLAFDWNFLNSLWIVSLIVGLIIAGISYALVTKALETLKNMDLTPKQTVETIKEDVKWIKNEVS